LDRHCPVPAATPFLSAGEGMTTPVPRLATIRAVANGTLGNNRGLLCRIALVPVAVVVCYLFDWAWLRATTTTTLVEISRLLGVPMHRTGEDLIELRGMHVQFVVACTMVDAFFGAIPLLWRTSVSVPRNFLRLFAVFVGVFVVNIFRLEAGFIALNKGIPWWLGHESVAGVTYFCLLLFIVHERAWSNAERPRLVVNHCAVSGQPLPSYDLSLKFEEFQREPQ